MAVITTIRSAFGFLTRLPVGPWPLQNDLNGISAWLPLVGLVVGGLAGILTWAATLLFPPLVCGVIGCACWVAVTGGLHLDGLADCCDGLLGSASRERRLEIMKDPHLGAFGVIGLFFALMLKAAALGLMPPSSGLSIVLAATLGRWLLLPVSRLPQARPGGMGADFAAGLQTGSIFFAAILPIGLAFLLGMQGWMAVLAALIAAAAVLGLAWKRIGGVTGDVLGALVEVTETAVLLVFTISCRAL